MPDDFEPINPPEPSAAAAMPDVEKLADSEDSDVIEARAKLLSAGASLVKAQTPLLDKLILRGVIPIALAIVGPWALYKFDRSMTEQAKQGETIVALQKLLKEEQKAQAARQARSAVWRGRMKKIEEERAAELTAMSSMVRRLDDTLKTALVQMAVARLISQPTETPRNTPQPVLSRRDVQRNISEQVQLPAADKKEVERLAGEAYDRILKARRKK